jgi:hypothetical protein
MQVREKEADIDTLILPIEDMYALLLRYEVRVCLHRRRWQCPGLFPCCDC